MSENDKNNELSSEELNDLLDEYIASIENRGETEKSHSGPLPDDILLPEVTGERSADPEISAAGSGQESLTMHFSDVSIAEMITERCAVIGHISNVIAQADLSCRFELLPLLCEDTKNKGFHSGISEPVGAYSLEALYISSIENGGYESLTLSYRSADGKRAQCTFDLRSMDRFNAELSSVSLTRLYMDYGI